MKSVISFVGLTWLLATTVDACSPRVPNFIPPQFCGDFSKILSERVAQRQIQDIENRRTEIINVHKCLSQPEPYSEIIQQFTNTTSEIINQYDRFALSFMIYCYSGRAPEDFYSTISRNLNDFLSLIENKTLIFRDFIQFKTNYKEVILSDNIVDKDNCPMTHLKTCGVESLRKLSNDTVALYQDTLRKTFEMATISYQAMGTSEIQKLNDGSEADSIVVKSVKSNSVRTFLDSKVVDDFKSFFQIPKYCGRVQHG